MTDTQWTSSLARGSADSPMWEMTCDRAALLKVWRRSKTGKPIRYREEIELQGRERGRGKNRKKRLDLTSLPKLPLSLLVLLYMHACIGNVFFITSIVIIIIVFLFTQLFFLPIAHVCTLLLTQTQTHNIPKKTHFHTCSAPCNQTTKNLIQMMNPMLSYCFVLLSDITSVRLSNQSPFQLCRTNKKMNNSSQNTYSIQKSSKLFFYTIRVGMFVAQYHSMFFHSVITTPYSSSVHC